MVDLPSTQLESPDPLSGPSAIDVVCGQVAEEHSNAHGRSANGILLILYYVRDALTSLDPADRDAFVQWLTKDSDA